MTLSPLAALLSTALFASAAAKAADWPEHFSKCAAQGGSCEAGNAKRQVSFGIKNAWVLKSLSGKFACSTATFGCDPYPRPGQKVRPGPARRRHHAADNATDHAANDAAGRQRSAYASGAANRLGQPQRGHPRRCGGTSNAIHLVGSPSQLLTALKAQARKPAQIKIYGTIDMAAGDNGGAFKNASDQGARSLIAIPSNTSVIGVGSDARIANGRIMIKGVDNVIVRKLTIANPCDMAPAWDPEDGSTGNWNSRYDGMNVDNATHVWIDHNTFTDAPRSDDQFPKENGKLKQCQDGALDIKNGADYVTVSNKAFQLHEKNTLVGSSDDSTGDDGHLTVTFHGNHYQGERNAKLYPHHYSIGVGYKAKIVSQHNAFDIIGARACGDAVEASGASGKSGAIVDSGSLLNGAALGLGGTGCTFSSAVGWTLPYTPVLLDAAKVRESVLRNAGAGKLTVR